MRRENLVTSPFTNTLKPSIRENTNKNLHSATLETQQSGRFRGGLFCATVSKKVSENKKIHFALSTITLIGSEGIIYQYSLFALLYPYQSVPIRKANKQSWRYVMLERG